MRSECFGDGVRAVCLASLSHSGGASGSRPTNRRSRHNPAIDAHDLLYSARSGAGARAAKRFITLKRRWRRRTLRSYRVAVIVLAVPLLAGAIIDRHLLSWALGVGIGALVALWAWLSDSPPPHIEYWRTGARGERRTASALAPLRRSGYVLIHDILDGAEETGRNIDHIVIGPSGVFVLDSKWLGGDASVEEDTVRVQRKDDPDDSYVVERLAGAVRAKAARVKGELAHTGVRWVHGVVVFWNDFEARSQESNNVHYISGDHLTDWALEAQPRVMSNDAVEKAADAMQRARPSKRSSTLRKWLDTWES